MRMHAFAIVFLVIWCGFLGFGLFVARQAIAGGMLALGLIIMCVGFYNEARMAESLLRRRLR